MTQEQFETLVTELEGYARRSPKDYKIRVGLLAALGYAYIFLILGIVLGIVIPLVIFMSIGGHFNIALMKIAVVLIGLAFVVLRSLNVSIPPPDGLPLSHETTPRLFQALNSICDGLKAPRFHHVLLTDDLNAGVIQVPKLGIFGWQVNYLLIGLPLMYALPPEQFRAVIAHEIGHLSANHSRFSGWIYRVRRTWVQILDNLHRSGHKGAFIFEKFLNWYAPYFSAYSFVLARNDEYTADRCAAEVTGRQTAAEALINVHLKSQYLQEEYWPEILKTAKDVSEPPQAAYASMLLALPKSAESDKTSLWYTEALNMKTDLTDTHPSLTSRLSALGFKGTVGGPLDTPKPPLPLPGPTTETAAETFLGGLAQRYSEQLNLAWRNDIRRGWEGRYAEAQETRKRLDFLSRKAEIETLTPKEQWEQVTGTVDVVGLDAAFPLLQRIVANDPAHAQATYALGQIFLERNDPQGVAFLEKAMELDATSTIPASESLYEFALRQDRPEEAMAYRKRGEQHIGLRVKAQEERETATPRDRFMDHGLSKEDVQKLSMQLAQHPRIKAAYLVRKQVVYFPEEPFYVLAIEPKRDFLESDTEAKDGFLIQSLISGLTMPGETYALLLTGSQKAMLKKLRPIPGSRIYTKL